MGQTHRCGRRNLISVYLFLVRNLQFGYMFDFDFDFDFDFVSVLVYIAIMADGR
jgi:hypothetical protein